MPKAPKKARKLSETYICGCVRRCGGVPRELSKRTYQLHAPFRTPEAKNQQEDAGESIPYGDFNPVSSKIYAH